MNILEDVKQQYNRGHRITQLIIINVGVFLLFLVVRLLMMIFGGAAGEASFEHVLELFEARKSLSDTLIHFWTPFTYMFLHADIWHIFFNMLYLYWFGQILEEMGGRKMILPIYLLGGLVGFVAFVLSGFTSLPIGETALGASASVMAIVAATATLVPTYALHLILLGRVELRWVALFLLTLDLASISILQASNNGGHLMHIGGIFTGWFIVYQRQNGRDFPEWFDARFSALGQWFSNLRKPKMTASRGGGNINQPNTVFNTPRHSSGDENPDQVVIDAILEKIKRSGIQSLSDQERAWLYKASKK